MKEILQGMMDTMYAIKPPRITALEDLHQAETRGPFSILIGTILSARTKDETTAKIVKKLFSRYRTAKALANAKVKDVEKIIKSIGFYGRKTANCVLVYAFDKPAIPVDVHVHRISNRLGLVKTKTPEETEMELMEKIPKKYWLEINDTFVMYGQNICKPISPMCSVCKIKRKCSYYKSKKSAS
jgi:endonuclease-3